MTHFELKQLVCRKLDVISYRIGLQYDGRNHASQPIMDILDWYPDNHVLSDKQMNQVNEWLAAL